MIRYMNTYGIYNIKLIFGMYKIWAKIGQISHVSSFLFE